MRRSGSARCILLTQGKRVSPWLGLIKHPANGYWTDRRWLVGQGALYLWLAVDRYGLHTWTGSDRLEEEPAWMCPPTRRTDSASTER